MGWRERLEDRLVVYDRILADFERKTAELERVAVSQERIANKFQEWITKPFTIRRVE